MVLVQCFRQPGQTPPVSKVFQVYLQAVHIQRSSARGSQWQSGQRMRPSPPPEPLSVGSTAGFPGMTVVGLSEATVSPVQMECEPIVPQAWDLRQGQTAAPANSCRTAAPWAPARR